MNKSKNPWLWKRVEQKKKVVQELYIIQYSLQDHFKTKLKTNFTWVIQHLGAPFGKAKFSQQIDESK